MAPARQGRAHRPTDPGDPLAQVIEDVLPNSDRERFYRDSPRHRTTITLVSHLLQLVIRYTSVVTAGPGLSGDAAALQIVEEFLNTIDERRFSLHGVQHTCGDALASPSDLAAWLVGRGLIQAGTLAEPADLAMARALREALRELLTVRAMPDIADQTAQARAAADAIADALLRANGTLNAHLLRVQADAGGTPVLVPARHGIPAALAAIAATVALAQAAGTWKRLKICGAADCRWVFYDTSRSGAGRWCSMRVCGNRAKTRTYRQRHQDQRSTV